MDESGVEREYRLAHLYDMEGRRVRLPHLDDWQP